MNKPNARLYLKGIILNLEQAEEEGYYIAYRDIIKQCKKALKELEE